MAIASPSDFVLISIGEAGSECCTLPGSVYCCDFAARDVWSTLCNNSESLYQAPFLWRAQYERAYQIAKLPFDLIDDCIANVPDRPAFIFSIGRCGSTLISALLRAAGAHVVSEPDFLSQLSVVDPRRIGADRCLPAQLMRLGLSSFAAQCGTDPVLKLRSQCNALSADIAGTFPHARFIVMLRERGSWVRSRYKAFGGQPQRFAHIYKSGIDTYDNLHRLSRHPHLIWYEDIVRDPASVLRGLAAIGISPDQRNLERALLTMATDSQQGTPLAQESLQERLPSTEWLLQFEDEWRSISPADAISRHSLERCR